MAPEEEPGAEKMDGKKKKGKKNNPEKSEGPIVGDIDSAAQQNNHHPADDGFNIGGAHFDFNMGPVDTVEPTLFHQETRSEQNNIFQPPINPNSVNPPYPQQAYGFQQPAQSSPASGVNPASIQPNIQQPPIHRVDAPPKVIAPKPPRSEADRVEVSNTNVAQPFIDPNKRNKVVRDQHPDIIQTDTPHIADTPSEAKFDNSALFSNYPYLKDIQEIALKHHIQLKMQMMGYTVNPMIPTGIILCHAFNDDNGVFNEYKSFTIDTGVIIDRRPKLFVGIVINGFEQLQAYAIQLNDKANKNKTTFNTELFEKIFVGGTTMLDDRGMYSPQYRKLNQVVDLSSMPTKLMNGERRRAIQDRLMNAMNAGVFDDALSKAPNSRFEFKEGSYDKDRGTFVLSNNNVPIGFNGPVISTILLEITFAPNKAVFVHDPNADLSSIEAAASNTTTGNSTADSAAPKQGKKNGGNNKKQNEPKAEAIVSADAPANPSTEG